MVFVPPANTYKVSYPHLPLPPPYTKSRMHAPKVTTARTVVRSFVDLDDPVIFQFIRNLNELSYNVVKIRNLAIDQTHDIPMWSESG